MVANEGVYYNRESYFGFWTRLFIDVIDGIVLLVISFVTLFVLFLFTDDYRVVVQVLLFAMGIVCSLYFVILKRSRIRTLGYIVCNARIVNLKGERPGIILLFLRLLFIAFGPINNVIDLVFLAGDENKQTLHDKVAQTYVIKANAQPVGRGRIIYRNYDVLGYNLLLREVERKEYLSGV